MSLVPSDTSGSTVTAVHSDSDSEEPEPTYPATQAELIAAKVVPQDYDNPGPAFPPNVVEDRRHYPVVLQAPVHLPGHFYR